MGKLTLLQNLTTPKLTLVKPTKPEIDNTTYHPFAIAIRNQLKKEGLDVNQAETLEKGRITWKFAYATGFSCFALLESLAHTHRVTIESAITTAPYRNASDFFRFIAKLNSNQPLPYRVAVNPFDAVIIQTQLEEHMIQSQALIEVLNHLGSFSEFIYNQLKFHFGALPYAAC